MAREALSLSLETFGERHPETAESYNTLACNLDEQGRYGEAEPLFRKALEVSKDVLGEQHPQTVAIQGGLERFLKKRP